MHIAGRGASYRETTRRQFIDLDYPADFCFIPAPRHEIGRPTAAGNARLTRRLAIERTSSRGRWNGRENGFDKGGDPAGRLW